MENIENRLKTLEEKVADIEKQIQNLPDKVITEIAEKLSNVTKNTTINYSTEQKEEDNNVFTAKELHCIARIIQSSFYAPNGSPFYGCQYCKYGLDCKDANDCRWDLVRDKIEETTGVKLRVLHNGAIEKRFLPQSFQELYPEEYKKIKATN